MTKNEIAIQALALAAQEAYELRVGSADFAVAASFMYDQAAQADWLKYLNEKQEAKAH